MHYVLTTVLDRLDVIDKFFFLGVTTIIYLIEYHRYKYN